MRTIFQNCTLLDGTEQMSPRPGTDVAIENDRIAQIGKITPNKGARIEFRYRVKIWTVNDGVKPKIALIFQFVAENAAKNPSNIVEYLQCVVRLFECDVIYNGAQGFVLDAFRCIRRLYQIQHKTGLLDELGRNFTAL